ncbi:Flp family type IVb pilin [Ralstonia mannitolilytica]|uniref:Flp family type IVb pilin n=1 Tax=Ralstonia mannitolilytica TaxID=105219 RepID=UPI0005D813D8|nr:Flp family type IVb pilin [Ralstonia mannitolilytica]AJW47286.1 pilus assembly protein [Ralstonia mannitolilytica]QIF09638.1 Flp family type IVb pilin [Ralstonia mannitolilytica]
MRAIITRFLREDEGATAIEYGLMAGLIAAAIVANVGGVGTQLGSVLTYISNKLTGIVPSS